MFSGIHKPAQRANLSGRQRDGRFHWFRMNAIRFLVVLALASFAAAQNSSPASPSIQPVDPSQPSSQSAAPQQNSTPGTVPSSSPPANSAQPGSAPPASTQPGSTQPASGQAGSTQSGPGQSGSAPSPQNSSPDTGTAPGAFVFKAQAEEVVLHATVVDADNRPVTGLDKSAFTIYEDGQAQKIRSFRTENVPVALGILIDNSGSMRMLRASVNQAAINLVKASNPRDGVFVVNFSDDAYLDQDFTSDIPKLRQALDRIGDRGTTAIYDALVASANHLERNVKTDKKILLLITDGADNASKETLRQTMQQLQRKDGPIIYVIALLDPNQLEARRTLEAIARETGGTAFFPASAQDAGAISETLAHDIRSQYTISYSPSTRRVPGKYHTIQVAAMGPTGKLQVRTRTGYYSGQEMDETNTDSPAVPSAPQSSTNP
ncbi:MAG TPA: VWA domain-containing protein [Terriglobales bacterium]|nr:VWA domain-containing protein [Terriglobales bacterium]